MTEDLLIIFVKNPVLGRVKTRLAATVGNEKALAVYLYLLERTKEISKPIMADKVVFYDSFLGENDLWDEPGFGKDVQAEGDLGNRMLEAFLKAFQHGYKRVCIIGSDCYELSTEILRSGFDSLDNNDAVIGGANDGGYYLLGMNRVIPEIFMNKAWSTSSVYQSTINDFRKLGLSFSELPKLNDVDNEEDLGPWANDL